MEISKAQLDEFIRLYERRFGKSIDRKFALIQAQKLLQLVQFLRQKKRPRISTRQEGQ